MSAKLQESLIIPIGNGITLRYDARHPEHVHTVLKKLAPISQLLKNIEHSPGVGDYFDEVTDRILQENDYSVKGRNMLVSRIGKLKHVILKDNPDKKMSDLSVADISKIKRRLPDAIKQNSKSKSRGENTQTYYQLFNRLMIEAKNDYFIAEDIFIKSSKSKHGAITKPFMREDIEELFNSWMYQTYSCSSATACRQDAYPYRFWLLPLSLFTGARLNELCQLQISDISKNEDGIHVIDFNDNGAHKSLKNEHSRREIPICRALVNMGFLDFVHEQRKSLGARAQLFNELTYSDYHHYSRIPSRFFCGARTGEGFIGKFCSTASDGALNFKSCRRSFANRLQASGTPTETIGHLLGHKKIMNHVTNKHYLDKPHSVWLLEILDSGLNYNVDLTNVRWTNFKKLMRYNENRKPRGRKAVGFR
tara:strand:+ start:2778 stop:4040 length:1263 start_codon:yes stop_codon:yes gene_type:complete